MNTKDLLAMLFERGNAMQSFWGFYITVALGVVAFFGARQRSIRLAILTSVIFIGFATVNCSGMHAIAQQRAALFDLFTVSEASTETSETATAHSSSIPLRITCALTSAAAPPTPTSVAAFHVVADVAVLAAVWLLTLAPRQPGKD